MRVLILENSEDDSLLILRELKQGGFEPDHLRVETRQGLEGRLLLFNRKALENMGGRLEDYLGKTYHELFGSDFGQDIAERFKSVQLTDEGQEYEDVIDLPTGRKWFLSSFTKVVDANGAIAGIQVISKDITERKRTMEALKAERDMAQRYLDVAGVMLLVLDAEARVVLVNKRGCEILGYEEAEIIGRN